MAVTRTSSPRKNHKSSDFHVDDRFLLDHLRDTRAEMSWRRDLEFRLMQFLLIFYPIIGTVLVELFQSDNIDSLSFAVISAGAIILILTATMIVTKRISHEHEIYVELGEQLLLIWSYFGMFESGAYLKDRAFLSKKLLDEKTGLGRGPGYKRTQLLIRVTSVTLIVMVGILAGIKYFTTL